MKYDRSCFLETPRLRLRCWIDSDREPFAKLNAHPEVMSDLGGPMSRTESDQKLKRYMTAFDQHGYSRWVLENLVGDFIGYAGVMPRLDKRHPLGAHNEIGWRLVREAWGCGYATEAAKASLKDAFNRTKLTNIVSYTSSDNLRSQAVMGRLDLVRDPKQDFVIQEKNNDEWRGLVWIVKPDRTN